MPADTPRSSALRRYAPFMAIVAVLVIVGIVFAVTRTDDFDDASPDTVDAALTFDEAVDEGIDTDDWHNCDQETGRIALPTSYTPPCVQPRQDDDEVSEGVQGVTDDSIRIVVYQSDPDLDPAVSAALGGLGVDTDPSLAADTISGYLDIIEEHFETYGRSLDVSFFRATGPSEDGDRARADAITIATEHEPFAVIGGPLQSPEFSAELAAREIVCLQNCALAPQREFAIESSPYIYSIGPVPEQAQYHAAEFVGTQLVGRNAEFAGDESFHDTERVFAYIAYNTTDGYYTPMIEEFTGRLRDEYGAEMAVQREFLLDLARNQEDAEGFVAALKDAGVTTVLYSGDPIMPIFMTEAATSQDYFPEWVVTATVYADTTAMARGYNQEQWQNAFGISLPAARAEGRTQPALALYEWQHCAPPPSNVFGVHVQGPLLLGIGIHMAGPDLTPESFEAGSFKYPPSGGQPSAALISRGEHDIWPNFDPGGSDDATVIYWDAEVEGVDETGQEGVGMYRYVENGQRYKPLEWPSEPLPLFDDSRSVTLLTDLDEGQMLPAYDSPCGGPALSAPSGRDGDE